MKTGSPRHVCHFLVSDGNRRGAGRSARRADGRCRMAPWTGVPVRVDGPQNVLVLERAEGAADLRRRAAHAGTPADRHIARPPNGGRSERGRRGGEQDMAGGNRGFIVTDGHQSHAVTVIEVPDTGARLVMFVGELPPVGRDMWVVRVAIDRTHRGAGARHAGGVICFTPDTRIATAAGPKLIQHLRRRHRAGRDDGPQPILWTGQRRSRRGAASCRICADPLSRRGLWHRPPGWRPAGLATTPHADPRPAGTGAVPAATRCWWQRKTC